MAITAAKFAGSCNSLSFCSTPAPPQRVQNLQGVKYSTLSFSKSTLSGNVLSRKSDVHRRSSRAAAVGMARSMAEEVEGRTPPTADTNVFVRLAWYGSEAFGKAVSVFRPRQAAAPELEEEGEMSVVERKDAVELIRADLDRSYFVTGNMATGIYEKDCEFADPFVSFKGLKRFKQNVSNLGTFMEESSLKLVDWQEYEDRIYAKWRFNCVLALPWRPILAASGSTEYFFKNDSGKIYKHVEIWDISPMDGLKQLFRPNPKRKSKNISSS